MRTNLAHPIDMRWSIGIVSIGLGLSPPVCRADPQLMVIASGACEDGNLLESGRLLEAALEERLGEKVMEQQQLLKRFGAPAGRSSEEIKGLLDSARVQYYASEYAKARSRVEDALVEIRMLPAGPIRWGLLVTAELLQGVVLRQIGENQGASEAFARVLRLDPHFQLDPDYYSPSICTEFDRIREQLRHLPKLRVEVRSNPSGADVFFDGFRVGVTPFAGDFLPGTYEVIAAKGGAMSRQHSLRVEKAELLHIDLDFEGMLGVNHILCLSDPGGEQSWIRGAVKLATLAGAEDVVVARLQRHPGDSSWFTASLVSSQSGGKIREAAIKIDGPTPARESLEKLADFIVTGKAEGAIVVVDDAQPSPPPGISRPQPVVQSTHDSADTWKIGSYASFGVSAAAAASALVLLLVNKADLNRLKGYEKPDGTLTNAPDVPGLVHAIDTRRGTATGLFVASGVAAASGVAFYFLARKQEYPRMDVSIAVNRTGGLLLVGTGF
jgi:PEGA domain-containing protein